ncbi:hypothetical protein EST38_g2625 [Candolleomyces aberdarensis]|uniref:Thaumatin-like protein n=1 Tax=Candolleomyces aberdarensis TaxID=2316362 RepID=A0A4Q2DSG7_9AGAR|nr:hypothetical protein EST38_g2625 [Candolleomyces aberdarensis]
MKFAALSALVLASGAAARTFTVYNACPFTIWPAIFTDLNVGSAKPNHVTGPGPQSCLTGGCNGGLVCDERTGAGVPPASLAEFTLGSDGWDWYDVSLVDGYNLPVRISNNVGCPVAECATDLGPNCPQALKGPFDASGFPVGCKSACFANLDGNPGNSRNCCTGQFSTPATCPASGVAFYDYFKSRCPRSYVYAYDEGSGTALFRCEANKRADYTITFCP